MTDYAWARSRVFPLKLWPLIIETNNDEKGEFATSQEDYEERRISNDRYFAALKDGGVWLS